MIEGNAGLFAGGSHHKGAAAGKEEGEGGRRGYLFDPRQTLYCTAFSANVVGGACMLAAGSAAGLVRVHRVMVVVEDGQEQDVFV